VAGDVVLLSSPVGRERGTVTDLVMEVNMMATLAVRETSCVAATTAGSSADITTRRMTAVRSRARQRRGPASPTTPTLH